ncbi:MAG TPA: hypothetical protein VH815_04170 [Acidobacteriota bacterium]
MQQPSKSRGAKILNYILITLGSALLAGVIVLIDYGHIYYRTPVQSRFRSSIHQDLKPGGRIGHKLGIAGSGMLVLLLIYSVRKRSKWMKNRGRLNLWLQFHIFLGVAGPILITFHSAFKLRGIVGISYWSMVIVALSGMVGRYLYAQIPRAISGKEKQSEEISGELQTINKRLAEVLPATALEQVQKIATFNETKNLSALRSLFTTLTDDIRWLSRKRKLQQILKSEPSIGDSERSEILKLARSREVHSRQIALLRGSQELFKYWHILHIPLAQTMYITMIIHIFVAVKMGYF